MVTMERFRISGMKKKDDLRAFRKKSRIKNHASSKLVLGDKMENFKNPEGNVSC